MQQPIPECPYTALFARIGAVVSPIVETDGGDADNRFYERTINGNKQYGISWPSAPQFGVYWFNREADRNARRLSA